MVHLDKNWLIVVLIAVIFSLNNYVLIRLDSSPLCADGGDNFCCSILYYRLFDQHQLPNIFGQFLKINPHRPPLLMLLPIPLYYFFGLTPDTALAASIIYIFILLLSLYTIGTRLFNKNVGVLAAAIIALYPGVFAFSRVFLDDFALMAFCSLWLAVLLSTDYFSRKRASVLLGVVGGLGLLTKANFIIFMIGPAAYYVFLSLRQRKNRVPILNIISAAAVSLAVSLVWYAVNIKEYFLLYFGSDHVTWDLPLSTDVFKNDNFFYYIRQLIFVQAYPFYAIIFLLALAVLIYRRKIASFGMRYLFLWFCVPYVVLSLSPMRTARYILPCLPALAIASAFGLTLLPPRSKKFLILSVLGIGVVQSVFISYGRNAHLFFPTVRMLTESIDNQNKVGQLRPVAVRNVSREILDLVCDERSSDHKVLFVSPQTGSLQAPLRYESQLKRLPVSVFFGNIYHDETCRWGRTIKPITDALNESDYLVISKEQIKEIMGTTEGRVSAVADTIRRTYQAIKVIKMPDEIDFGREWIIFLNRHL